MRVLTFCAAVAAGVLVSLGGAVPAHAAPPGAAVLSAATRSCPPVSAGRYAADTGRRATVPICRSGSVLFWTADMDIDCDGIRTVRCNRSTDPWFQAQTSFRTSAGRYYRADTDRYFVVPLPSSRFDYRRAGVRPGCVAAVVYKGRVAYAVFADEGPAGIIGEGSYGLAVALGIDPDPAAGGTDGPVTFIVFPSVVPRPAGSGAAVDTAGAVAAAVWLRGR